MKVKYPRTYHLAWSDGVSSDDKVQSDLSLLQKEVVITEKMDGENSSIYRDYYHARSLDSVDHPSRHWLKGFWGSMRHLIPENFRICGENLYAKHSIEYNELPSYFMVFSIWDGDICLSWDETVEWCQLLGLVTVPVLGRGFYTENDLRNLKLDLSKQEGYVVRNAGSFHFDDFSKNCLKWVRKGHVQTSEHWMFSKVQPNKLK
jgi:hypothetical protein